MKSSELPTNPCPRPVWKVSEFTAPSDPELNWALLRLWLCPLFVTLRMFDAQILAISIAACKRIFTGGMTWVQVFKNGPNKICGKKAFKKSEVIWSALAETCLLIYSVRRVY